MNENVKSVIRIIIFLSAISAVIFLTNGCAGNAVVKSNEDIGTIRNAYNELERRYRTLESEYNALIERQKQFINDYSEAERGIGDRIEELTGASNGITESVGGISGDNREAIRLIQQYLESIGYTGKDDSLP